MLCVIGSLVGQVSLLFPQTWWFTLFYIILQEVIITPVMFSFTLDDSLFTIIVSPFNLDYYRNNFVTCTGGSYNDIESHRMMTITELKFKEIGETFMNLLHKMQKCLKFSSRQFSLVVWRPFCVSLTWSLARVLWCCAQKIIRCHKILYRPLNYNLQPVSVFFFPLIFHRCNWAPMWQQSHCETARR